jgi:GxxExxY protein
MANAWPRNWTKPASRSSDKSPSPVIYKGKILSLGFRADILVASTILLEIKAVTALLPAHDAQILTYLRMSQIRVGLLQISTPSA